jgi:hypothetical protein
MLEIQHARMVRLPMDRRIGVARRTWPSAANRALFWLDLI